MIDSQSVAERHRRLRLHILDCSRRRYVYYYSKAGSFPDRLSCWFRQEWSRCKSLTSKTASTNTCCPIWLVKSSWDRWDFVSGFRKTCRKIRFREISRNCVSTQHTPYKNEYRTHYITASLNSWIWSESNRRLSRNWSVSRRFRHIKWNYKWIKYASMTCQQFNTFKNCSSWQIAIV